VSSVSSCTSSSEEDDVAGDSDDDELVDKSLRKVQKKSIFGFQVRDKRKENAEK
jgi:hypothetical protein